MKKLWMWSTIVFALQAVTFFSVLYLFGAPVKDASLAATTIAIVTASVFVLGGFSLAFAAIAAAATLAALAAIAAAIAFLAAAAVAFLAAGVATLTLAFAAAIAFLAAKEVEATHSDEPLWALFIAALPLGVGTVLGGTLYFFYFRNKPLALAPRG
ncbi:MAG: hypothetical protein A3G11_01605 [Candidatus Lloydbacteria bacterium RIFCSPLOWO2_12_FULL_51_9]|uniref:Uncharacterized protein n=1 Tax=Candidatus Lloydbacteria bacterium RIFCSPLOWO2_12_FULL_51_9 TaxID=1798669 RepID=A0A1G2DQX1_9BACT|nr:MAG: hypothetical protein A3G11_01605 [Candidatus Lloydbacteria bacterium RIFCSPLOWO2_12_FULL_51_9]